MAARSEEWEGPSISGNTIVPAPSYGPLGLIAGAFAKAQVEMANPKFDAANPFFKSKFASLAAVRNAVVPLLAKNGICMAQDLTTAEGSISCTTILTHSSGQQMRFGPLTLPITKADAQGYAAAGTYAKRISLQSVCGVVGDEDDDGDTHRKDDGKKPISDEYTAGAQKGIAADVARSHAMKMIAIILAPAKDGDHDESGKAKEAMAYHTQYLAGNNELYIAAAEQMDVTKRNIWKALIAKAKEDAKGRRF